MTRLTNRGIKVVKHILDNDASENYLQAIWRNAMNTKKSFKDHFQAIMVGVDNAFPMHLWDCLLPQAESMLNMMQSTNIMPTISTYMYMYEQHNFNKMPLAPMGAQSCYTTSQTSEKHGTYMQSRVFTLRHHENTTDAIRCGSKKHKVSTSPCQQSAKQMP